MLLLPDVPGAAEVADALVTGREPEQWPADLEHVRLALAGDPEAAVAAIRGDDVVARYNAAVLVGGHGVWESLDAETDGEMRVLVRTAAYSVGVIDEPPQAQDATGEVAALVESARASAYLEIGDVATAVALLGDAAQHAADAGSPLFSASLRLTRSDLLRENLDDAASAAGEADFAIRSLPLTAPSELRAELQVARALSRQLLAGSERGALLAVVADLTEAVKVLREDTHPELFAVVNRQLALAYLMMPMGADGDRIRLGVAVTSMRAALRVFTPETHPAEWASTQLNLANALQYLPSVHQAENLDEAVQLYEEVLRHRDVGRDPLGVARVLTNQGNALGHLGAIDDAEERLGRARELFATVGDAEGVAAVDELLAEVAEAAARQAAR
jgi:tetratricopeptide (TPR) repeat protein